ncbi:MAG: RNA 2',3'-cyclic phosphodiesterase [Oscillospiraceae bacterium]|jgi:2'-5' RNA ligase
MRLFFGLPFDAETCAAVRRVQSRLEECAQRGRFTDPGNFHLTLAFLGEVEEERLKTLRTILRENPIPPIDLLFDRLGQFGGGICYLAPRTCPTLLKGQAALESTLRRAGFELEERLYTPHLTLGRKVVFSAGKDLSGSLEPPVPAHSSGAALFHSHRVGGCLRYTRLEPDFRSGPDA